MIFQELIKIETIAKNIPLVLCIVWLYTQNNRITTLENKLENCWLFRSSINQGLTSENDPLNHRHLHYKYAVLPKEVEVKIKKA